MSFIYLCNYKYLGKGAFSLSSNDSFYHYFVFKQNEYNLFEYFVSYPPKIIIYFFSRQNIILLIQCLILYIIFVFIKKIIFNSETVILYFIYSISTCTMRIEARRFIFLIFINCPIFCLEIVII